MMVNKREEITDLISDEAYDDPKFKRGLVLKFESATLKLTKVDRKNKRVWAEHITLFDGRPVMTHYGHDVVSTGPGDLPFCNDCQVNINEASTEDGEVKARDRADRMLADGTIIE